MGESSHEDNLAHFFLNKIDHSRLVDVEPIVIIPT